MGDLPNIFPLQKSMLANLGLFYTNRKTSLFYLVDISPVFHEKGFSMSPNRVLCILTQCVTDNISSCILGLNIVFRVCFSLCIQRVVIYYIFLGLSSISCSTEYCLLKTQLKNCPLTCLSLLGISEFKTIANCLCFSLLYIQGE